MKIYAINKSDGSVSIMHILDENTDVETELTKWPQDEQDKVVGHTEIYQEDIPVDRYFRAAWGHDAKVDMSKARDIHLNEIRKVRDEKLKELDIETMKGNDVQAEKQALRDIPQTLDLSKANTPEDLKKLWPSKL